MKRIPQDTTFKTDSSIKRNGVDLETCKLEYKRAKKAYKHDKSNEELRMAKSIAKKALKEAETVEISDAHISFSSPSHKRRNKRKRKNPSSSATTSKCVGSSNTTTKQIFNGLIVAISTLESKQTNCANKLTGDDPSNETMNNTKALKSLLQSLGATVSPQVHKRVHYLISTDSAMQNLTQRVRQAFKRNVDIIDIEWVTKCREKNARVNAGNYLCNELVQCLIEEKEREKRKLLASDGIAGNSDIPDENAGWTKPVELDCCCVCHEVCMCGTYQSGMILYYLILAPYH